MGRVYGNPCSHSTCSYIPSPLASLTYVQIKPLDPTGSIFSLIPRSVSKDKLVFGLVGGIFKDLPEFSPKIQERRSIMASMCDQVMVDIRVGMQKTWKGSLRESIPCSKVI